MLVVQVVQVPYLDKEKSRIAVNSGERSKLSNLYPKKKK